VPSLKLHAARLWQLSLPTAPSFWPHAAWPTHEASPIGAVLASQLREPMHAALRIAPRFSSHASSPSRAFRDRALIGATGNYTPLSLATDPAGSPRPSAHRCLRSRTNGRGPSASAAPFSIRLVKTDFGRYQLENFHTTTNTGVKQLSRALHLAWRRAAHAGLKARAEVPQFTGDVFPTRTGTEPPAEQRRPHHSRVDRLPTLSRDDRTIALRAPTLE
jgi:hypothetical protein